MHRERFPSMLDVDARWRREAAVAGAIEAFDYITYAAI